MAPRNKLRRCLPRPTDAIRIEKEANETRYEDRVHAVVGAARDIMQRNPEASELAVMVFSSMERGDEGDGGGFALRCGIDDDGARRLLRAVSSSKARRPFERKSAVHEYRMDGVTLAVEKMCGTSSQERGDVRIRCWEERCCEMEVMDGFALAATSRKSVKPHSFSSRADVHSEDSFERLSIECGSGIRIVLDCFEAGKSSARVFIRKMDYNFPYKAACAAVGCLSAAK
nr:hypothetical protein TetV2_00359 [Oceanusvirus sp.]